MFRGTVLTISDYRRKTILESNLRIRYEIRRSVTFIGFGNLVIIERNGQKCRNGIRKRPRLPSWN